MFILTACVFVTRIKKSCDSAKCVLHIYWKSIDCCAMGHWTMQWISPTGAIKDFAHNEKHFVIKVAVSFQFTSIFHLLPITVVRLYHTNCANADIFLLLICCQHKCDLLCFISTLISIHISSRKRGRKNKLI